MPTVVTVPTYALPKRPMQLLVTVTDSSANYARVWVTDAPGKSKLRKQLDENESGRVQIYEGDAKQAFAYDGFDVGGKYTLKVQEFSKGAVLQNGGGYEGAPNTYQGETAIGAEATISIYMGQRMVLPVGAGPDMCDLVLYVWNDTIRATTVAVHGEKSPALSAFKTERARFAGTNSTVIADLTYLVNQTATTILDDLSAAITDVITKFNLHRSQATVHAANDTDNVIDPSFKNPKGPKGFIASVNEVLQKLDRHMRNAKDGALATGSQGYHAPGAVRQADLKYIPTVGAASDVGTAAVALWAIRASYGEHIGSLDVHTNADATNTLAGGAAGTLSYLFRDFFLVLNASTPIVPSAEQTGAVQLTQLAGFKEQSG